MITSDQWDTGDDFRTLQLAFKRKWKSRDFRGLEALLGSPPACLGKKRVDMLTLFGLLHREMVY